jgi:hypothetical protein
MPLRLIWWFSTPISNLCDQMALIRFPLSAPTSKSQNCSEPTDLNHIDTNELHIAGPATKQEEFASEIRQNGPRRREIQKTGNRCQLIRPE